MGSVRGHVCEAEIGGRQEHQPRGESSTPSGCGQKLEMKAAEEKVGWQAKTWRGKELNTP